MWISFGAACKENTGNFLVRKSSMAWSIGETKKIQLNTDK